MESRRSCSDAFLLVAATSRRQRGRAEQAAQSGFRNFNSGWPHPEADHTGVAANWVHPGVSEVLVKGDDDGAVLLRPLEDCGVCGAAQPNLDHVANRPLWPLATKVIAGRGGNVLVEQDR
jgi:hypothetical protein